MPSHPPHSSDADDDAASVAAPPGHDPGHAPPGIRWADLIEPLVASHGGWTALADTLIRRAGPSAQLSTFTVEKGLRRLAKREHEDGGRYGRLLLRHFGVPRAIEDWARWLAQYHGRFTDLPSSLRLEQLRIWDRPPISESPVAAWIDVGLASAHHRRGELDACHRRLAGARTFAKRHRSDAEIEVALFDARLFGDDDDPFAASRELDRAERAIDAHSIPRADRLCYRARLLGQRAFLLTRPPPGRAPDLLGARELFLAIEEDPAVPFASFRRANGLAYCAWQLGDPSEGARLARLAAEHAADAGLVRFRVMALSMLSRMLPPDEAGPVIARTERLARALEDEELVRRVDRDARALTQRALPPPPAR